MIPILTKGRDIPRDGCGGYPGGEHFFRDPYGIMRGTLPGHVRFWRKNQINKKTTKRIAAKVSKPNNLKNFGRVKGKHVFCTIYFLNWQEENDVAWVCFQKIQGVISKPQRIQGHSIVLVINGHGCQRIENKLPKHIPGTFQEHIGNITMSEHRQPKQQQKSCTTWQDM